MKGLDILLVCLIFIILIFAFSNCSMICQMKENFGGLEPASRWAVGGLAGPDGTGKFGQYDLINGQIVVPHNESMPVMRYQIMNSNDRKAQMLQNASNEMYQSGKYLLPSPEYMGPPSCN